MSEVGRGPITPVDRRSPVLRYRQVADDLIRRIAASQFTPDLPNERALVEQYGVSYSTVRHAIKVLRQEELIVTLHGLGSYVTDTARKRFGSARRSSGRQDDYEGVTHPQVRPDPALGLLTMYDEALPHVYGYLLARCGDPCLAEDLTAESFLAAVHAARKPGAAGPSVPWLIGVARHKLADHWRRTEREQRGLRLLDGEAAVDDDPWQEVVDRIRAREVLELLGAHHRAALTLRYLDGLPVPEVASHLGRTLHATEALLVRARAAFRQVYQAQEDSR